MEREQVLDTSSQEYEDLFLWSRHNKRARSSKHMATDDEVRLFKSWIRFCSDNHDMCSIRKFFFSNEAKIILIDTGRLCLVNADTSYRFAALSYVWGKVRHFHLMESNKSQLFETNSLLNFWPQIPQVIRGAIDFTDRIGERFLWVDALCIIQDSALKHDELLHMADIYNNATVSLMACIGENADSPLRSEKRVIYGAYGMYSSFEEVYRIDEPEKALEQIKSTRHSSRGWTYQERMLSRRRIFFLENDIIFHCRSDVFSPSGSEPVLRKPSITKVVTSREGVGGGRGEIDPLESFNAQLMPEWPTDLNEESWEKGFRFWSTAMEEYSARSLSFKHDVLNACSAILQAIRARTEWTFVQGIPLKMVEPALLWIPVSSISRRKVGPYATLSELSFSSWSWAAWTGQITYAMSRTENQIREFESRLENLTVLIGSKHFSGQYEGHYLYSSSDRKGNDLEGMRLFFDPQVHSPPGLPLNNLRSKQGTRIAKSSPFVRNKPWLRDRFGAQTGNLPPTRNQDNVQGAHPSFSLQADDHEPDDYGLEDQDPTSESGLQRSLLNSWQPLDDGPNYIIRDDDVEETGENHSNVRSLTEMFSFALCFVAQYSPAVRFCLTLESPCIGRVTSGPDIGKGSELPPARLAAGDLEGPDPKYSSWIDKFEKLELQKQVLRGQNQKKYDVFSSQATLVQIETHVGGMCGFIYGVSESDQNRIEGGRFADFEMILLSDCRTSAFGLESHFATAMPQPPAHLRAGVGTMKNIMLVRRVGRMIERVGVGEMLGAFWESRICGTKSFILR